jgi:hypothetical protein
MASEIFFILFPNFSSGAHLLAIKSDSTRQQYQGSGDAGRGAGERIDIVGDEQIQLVVADVRR